jgi:hypothetical protein
LLANALGEQHFQTHDRHRYPVEASKSELARVRTKCDRSPGRSAR